MSAIAILSPNDHAHRWLIDAPNGPTSVGRCKVCRAEKTFRNWLEEIDFINETTVRATGSRVAA
ncbi:MAG: hypothetical protein ACKVVT_15940 [Dehalococcoidia bacterium]